MLVIAESPIEGALQTNTYGIRLNPTKLSPFIPPRSPRCYLNSTELAGWRKELESALVSTLRQVIAEQLQCSHQPKYHSVILCSLGPRYLIKDMAWKAVISSALLLFAHCFSSEASASPVDDSEKVFTTTLYQIPSLQTVQPPSNPKTLAVLTYKPSDPSLSTIRSFNPPSNSSTTKTPEDLTQILTYLSATHSPSHFRTTSTLTRAFHAPYTGRFRLVIDPKTGDILSASWRAWLSVDKSPSKDETRKTKQKRSEPAKDRKKQQQRKSGGKKSKGAEEVIRDERGDFDIVVPGQAPAVVFDRKPRAAGAGAAGAGGSGGGAASTAGGDGEEGEEEDQRTFLQKYWWLMLGIAVLAVTSSGGGGDR